MIRWLVTSALLLLATPVAVVAQQPIAAAADKQELAAQVARITNSEEVTRIQTRKLLAETLPKTMADNAEFVEMERDSPGLIKAVVEATAPLITESTIRQLPLLWARLAPIFTRTFTAEELRALLDFYTSPAGARLLKTMAGGADFSASLSNTMASGGSTLTTQHARAAALAGGVEVARSASPEDLAALQAFANSAAGIKMRAIADEVREATVAWGNEPDPALDAQIEKTVEAVVTKFAGMSKQ